MLIIDLLITGSLVKFVNLTDDPRTATIIYLVYLFFMQLIFSQNDWLLLVITLAIKGILAYFYFWLLCRIQGTIAWLLTVVVGMLILFFI